MGPRPGRRCDLGCESWPDELIYQKCPVCGEPTARYTNLNPVDPDEARSVIRHKAFERFYEVHCQKKGQPVEGPLLSLDPEVERLLNSLSGGEEKATADTS